MFDLKDALFLAAVLFAYALASYLDHRDEALLKPARSTGNEAGCTPPGAFDGPERHFAPAPSASTAPAIPARCAARPFVTEEHAMPAPSCTHPDAATKLYAVRSFADIEFLVKESEVLTGRAGRCFVIAGADRLIYRLHWQPVGLTVERLDAQGQLLDSRHLMPAQFGSHQLAAALACGQLFTPAARDCHAGQ